jgi:hypothetical protein
MIDQPTAEQALKELEVLVGVWSQQATPPGGEPWPGEATRTFEISDDGNTIDGRWEVNEGDGWKTDFDLVYTRVS